MVAFYLQTQMLAALAVGHVLNSLPESFFIAFFAWGLLRLRPRQNSRTRFAVWFVALLAAALVPFFAGLGHISTYLSSSRAPLHLPMPLAAVLFVVWFMVAVVMIVRLFVGLWSLYKLRQTCSPLDHKGLQPELRQLLANLNSGVSRARQVTLATSDRVRVPAAIGIWKPMIVLPAWLLRELSPGDLSIVLHHESAHLRNWDDWTNLVQKLVRAVFFFHPVVWWMESQLSVEREMACDDFVLAKTANPAGYASCLVSLLEKSLAERGWTMAQAIVHRARETSLRLARILDSRRPTATHISKPVLGLVGSVAALCLFLLPSAPPVVSFQQPAQDSPQRYLAAATNQSLMTPAMVVPAMVHHADFASGSARPVVVSASVEHGMKNSSSSRKTTINSRAPIPAVTARASAPSPSLARNQNGNEGMAESAFLASLTDALVEQSQLLNLRYSPGIENSVPAVFVVRAAGLTAADSQAPVVEWHVVIWRVTVVHATGAAMVNSPAPHAT